MSDTRNSIKIGITKNLQNRMKSYRTTWGNDMIILHTVLLDTPRIAQSCESEIKRKLRAYTKPGTTECFIVQPDIAVQTIIRTTAPYIVSPYVSNTKCVIV